MPAIVKFNGNNHDISTLSGIDYGEKCLGPGSWHGTKGGIWNVGCDYGVTIGQSLSGWSRFVKTGNPFADPCIVNCGIWHKPPPECKITPAGMGEPPPKNKCPKDWYKTKEEAAGHVRKTVVPSACFVWKPGSAKCPWRVIPGTGCAHWVAHQLNLKGSTKCDAGFLIRVKDVVNGRKELRLRAAAPGNLWTNRDKSHIGIIRVVKKNDKGDVVQVLVEHDSDSETGGGRGVVKNWFFDGKIWGDKKKSAKVNS